MTFAVTGSRDWKDPEPIDVALRWAYERGYRTLVHGSCIGADMIAGGIWTLLTFDWVQRRIMPAKWNLFGDAAGPLRNAAMLHVWEPTLVLAFPLPKSKGTWNMVDQVRKINAAKPGAIDLRIWPNDELWHSAPPKEPAP